MKKTVLLIPALAASISLGATEPSLELVSSATNVVVTEQVQVSLVLRLPPVPGAYADNQPPFLNQRPPHFTCSFLEPQWNSESFARGNNVQVTNCFDPVSNWTTLPQSPIADFTNGNIYKKLSDAAPGIWYLSAAENGHPVLYVPEETTGIRTAATATASQQVYDLQGRQMTKDAPLTKGLYIVNGRKVVVK